MHFFIYLCFIYLCVFVSCDALGSSSHCTLWPKWALQGKGVVYVPASTHISSLEKQQFYHVLHRSWLLYLDFFLWPYDMSCMCYWCQLMPSNMHRSTSWLVCYCDTWTRETVAAKAQSVLNWATAFYCLWIKMYICKRKNVYAFFQKLHSLAFNKENQCRTSLKVP